MTEEERKKRTSQLKSHTRTAQKWLNDRPSDCRLFIYCEEDDSARTCISAGTTLHIINFLTDAIEGLAARDNTTFEHILLDIAMAYQTKKAISEGRTWRDPTFLEWFYQERAEAQTNTQPITSDSDKKAE